VVWEEHQTFFTVGDDAFVVALLVADDVTHWKKLSVHGGKRIARGLTQISAVSQLVLNTE
jgi:hypothetical protein